MAAAARGAAGKGKRARYRSSEEPAQLLEEECCGGSWPTVAQVAAASGGMGRSGWRRAKAWGFEVRGVVDSLCRKKPIVTGVISLW